MNKHFALVLAVVSLPTVALAKGAVQTSPEAAATYQDIQKTLGSVPGFFKSMPEEGIAGAWSEMKSIQLSPETAIPGKYKELIGLAVAAQIPCKYCIYFHTEAAGLNGASPAELHEAIAMAAITRHWSTILNGLAIDEELFRKEVGQVVDYLKKPHAAPAAVAVTDAASAYKDIQATLGSVPTMYKAFPPAGIAGAWREQKSVQLNPASAIPGKYKELMGLAVAAQIPCKYCVFFHTQAAKLQGASDAEIAEAVAMAGITRHWSTVLNGNQIDEATFRKEVDTVVRGFKKQAKVR
jgi:AhpD family alkylhydroperoxidase